VFGQIQGKRVQILRDVRERPESGLLRQVVADGAELIKPLAQDSPGRVPMG
jgi:hypothetical protein